MADDITFRLDQALAAQQAIRASLGMRDEVFRVDALVGMLSDEIEASRKAGRSDEDTAALVRQATGKLVTAEDLRRFYAPPHQRHRHDGSE